MLPIGLKLTDDEWETMKNVLHDWGLIDTYFIADWAKVQDLKEKLLKE